MTRTTEPQSIRRAGSAAGPGSTRQSKIAETTQAQAKLRDAQAPDRAQEDLRRSTSLLKSGSTTAPMGRPAEISTQTSMVNSLQAALNRAEWRLDQRSVVSPDAEIVADLLAQRGETLAAGAPVVSLLPARKRSSCTSSFRRPNSRAPTSARKSHLSAITGGPGRDHFLHCRRPNVRPLHLFKIEPRQVRLSRRSVGRRRRRPRHSTPACR